MSDVPRDDQGRDAHQIIADANRRALHAYPGATPFDTSREPLLGPPADMAVSRVLLAERPDIDRREADRLAVLIVDAIAKATGQPDPDTSERPATRTDRAAIQGFWQCRQDPSHPRLISMQAPRCVICGSACE